MGIFNRKKKYVKSIKLINEKSIANLRSKIKVLIVDDQEFLLVSALNQRKYDIYYKKDMNYAIEAEPFDIVILDIKGIAGNLGSNMEGFSLAKEVKKIYPNKKVLCYSSSVRTEIASELEQIDGFIHKDIEIDQWANKLDKLIEEYISFEYQWGVLEKRLKENKIQDSDIQDIYKVFKESFDNNSFESLDQLLIDKLDNVQLLFKVMESIYSFIKLVAAA